MNARRTPYKSLANMMVTRLIPNVTEDMRETEADNFLQYIKRLEKSMKSPDPYNRARSSTKKKTQQKNHSFHKPSFDMMVYDSADLLEFVCTYYEMAESYNENEKLVGRRAKNYYDNKIDLDKDYDFIFNLLKKCDPQTGYIDFHTNTDVWASYYNDQRSKIQEQAITTSQMLMIKATEDNLKFNVRRCYAMTLLTLIENMLDHLKIFIENAHEEYVGILKNINTYRCAWQLANWSILQSLTTLLIQRNYTSGLNNFDSLKSKLEGIADNLYSEVSTIPFNKSDSLYGGFYLYLYMLTIYNEYAKDKEIEENALEEIYGEDLYNKKSNISDEYSFFDKDGALLPSANIEKIDKEKFHLGDKTCTQETFEKRLEFCRKFIEFYNQKTPRYLDAKNISVLRAVYKTFYISGLTYKDKSIYTLAKDLMKSNDYSMLMLNHHVINRENYCEMRNGIDIYKAVAMLSKPINKIFLYTFYRDCPRLEDTSIEDYLCRLKRIFKTVKNRIYLELL